MAHLLEHLVFKGTPKHPNVPKALQDHGAQFNGSTSVDEAVAAVVAEAEAEASVH